MNILNLIVDSSGGVEARFEIECELLILKLLDVVEVLREDQGSELLKLELAAFEQALDEDEQEMVVLVGRKEVLRRLGHNLSKHLFLLLDFQFSYFSSFYSINFNL